MRKSYRNFEKMDHEDRDAVRGLVSQVCATLEAHTKPTSCRRRKSSTTRPRRWPSNPAYTQRRKLNLRALGKKLAERKLRLLPR